MDALSMIDRGTPTVDTVAPTKPMNKKEQQFGAVLDTKQHTHHQHESKPVDNRPETAEGPKEKQVTAHNSKTEVKQKVAEQEESSNEVATKSTLQSEAETIPQWQVKVQHTLVDLMKTVLQGETTGAEAEDSNGIVMLLTDLVQQLESTDCHGEQVLAGVDLSALAAELQSLNEGSDREELLAKLVTQIEEQLASEIDLPENTELPMTMVADPLPQNTTPIVVENMAQARQILQKAFDSAILQKSVTAEKVVIEETVFATEETAEEIDPRFAGLLKPRSEQHSAQQGLPEKEQMSLRHGKQSVELKQGEPVVQVPATEMTIQSQEAKTIQTFGDTAKQVLENLVQQSPHNLHSQGQPQVQGLEVNKAMPQTPVVQLASGQQVPESQIFDQVVTHLSGSVNGESGRMVLRLQPAELGSLKLELMVEGDRIRANLHAQSHQVQEVLERNLPQLRNALAEQGLKIDQFQVNVDQRQHNGQSENLAQQHQRHGSEKQPDWQQQNLEPEEQIIPLAHLMQNGGGGISLHV